MKTIQKIDIIISLKSWLFLGGIIGFCGGFAFGAINATYTVIAKNDFAEAGKTFIGLVIGAPFLFSVAALLGYPMYRFILCKSERYRTIHISSNISSSAGHS